MRTQEEMLDLVLRVAEADERIRIVGFNGSRVNPNAPKDLFQDYDVAYLVTELDSFKADKTWIDVFGRRLLMQMPEDMDLFPPEIGNRFSYLMYLEDGVYLDLTLIPLEEREVWAGEDTLTQVLLDKDGLLPSLPPACDRAHWVKPPSPSYFADCCNDFWWVLHYVGKGLWRDELTYAAEHLNGILRPDLMRMLSWKAGVDTGFSVNTGKCGKYLKPYFPKEEWDMLLSTLNNGSVEACWNSVFTMMELFRRASRIVAGHFGYPYPEEDDRNAVKVMERIRAMDREEREIF